LPRAGRAQRVAARVLEHLPGERAVAGPGGLARRRGLVLCLGHLGLDRRARSDDRGGEVLDGVRAVIYCPRCEESPCRCQLLMSRRTFLFGITSAAAAAIVVPQLGFLEPVDVAQRTELAIALERVSIGSYDAILKELYLPAIVEKIRELTLFEVWNQEL